jgi:hypothetical protein
MFRDDYSTDASHEIITCPLIQILFSALPGFLSSQFPTVSAPLSRNRLAVGDHSKDDFIK